MEWNDWAVSAVGGILSGISFAIGYQLGWKDALKPRKQVPTWRVG